MNYQVGQEIFQSQRIMHKEKKGTPPPPPLNVSWTAHIVSSLWTNSTRNLNLEDLPYSRGYCTRAAIKRKPYHKRYGVAETGRH